MEGSNPNNFDPNNYIQDQINMNNNMNAGMYNNDPVNMNGQVNNSMNAGMYNNNQVNMNGQMNNSMNAGMYNNDQVNMNGQMNNSMNAGMYNNGQMNNGMNAGMYNNGQMNNNMYNQPVINNSKPEVSDAESNKKGNLLSLISLLLWIGPTIAYAIFAALVALSDNGSYAYTFDNILNNIGGTLASFIPMLTLAAYAVMIYTRIKYPKNIFAKVLMWIYIISFIISVIASILLIAFIIYMCRECSQAFFISFVPYL